MLKNTQINRLATRKIAQALGELNEQVVYVGGAVVSLYIDDPSADDVRPTKDVDISLEIASIGALEALRVSLIRKGFYQSVEDNVLCRFRYEDIKVDEMSTEPVGWAPANRWFAHGFQHRLPRQLDEMTIHILPLPYFLASKLEAFYDRGKTDPRTSHDFEDIVYLLNYTSDFKSQIQASKDELKQYLIERFTDILTDMAKQEAILGCLYHEDQSLRFNKIINLLNEIIAWPSPSSTA
ncbi:MAG: nucleotidyl transferase AbiEii/AbiGii toxin family protein [Phycisphaerae bacterium]|nr:nucleotidyl transferase AbiEii/AbiGii toxin family protein [Saprospiraceae bacterium]